MPVDDGLARRAADLVGRYDDLPLGTSDAFVMAVAERFDAQRIATLDRRHFRIVQPRRAHAASVSTPRTRQNRDKDSR